MERLDLGRLLECYQIAGFFLKKIGKNQKLKILSKFF